ncbi:hypothetical protein ACFVGY_09030 [Streptomyces sp. NPDC127106]|uniref:hypothetical protein n=1 Tax=Streptomyces sp. NPDC127106 TaxID=3345360 RepID=UPI0036339BBF
MGDNTNDDRPAVSDEEWARFLQQAGADTADAPKEPSARAREVTARLRREEEQRARAAKWTRKKGGTRPSDPPGWRTGPAWQELEGRGRGRRRLKAGLAIAAVAALALVALRPELVIDRLTGKAAQRGAEAAREPLPAETARPSGAPSATLPDRPTLREPFRGSPAAQWADGAAGIEVPEARALNGVSKEQVAEGLARTKQFLVAANLDPATLRGERPQAALDLIDPAQDELVALVERSLAKPDRDSDPLNLFTRFQAAEARPAGDVVKVRGRMELEPGEKPGLVDVVVDYSFVYPVVEARAGAEEVTRSIVRRQMEFTIADPVRWRIKPGTLQLGPYASDIANSSCDRWDGYVHPEFSGRPASGPTPSGTPQDPYDRSKDIRSGGTEGCATASRL